MAFQWIGYVTVDSTGCCAFAMVCFCQQIAEAAIEVRGGFVKVSAISKTVAFGAVGLLAAAGIGAGGIALAAPQSATTIHACASRSSGALRLATHCRRTEHAVSWNKAGPAGPSHVYASFHDAATFVPFSSTATLGSLALPQGTFTVFAKAWVQSQAGSGNSDVFCSLVLGPNFDEGTVDAQDGNTPTGPEPVRNEMLELNVNGSLSGPGHALLQCRNFGGGNTDLLFIKITAIKVGGLTNTGF